jgi:Mannosyl-glycoprotein endo-beta-N-acetylglucosaminidase/CHAP domain
MADKITRFIRLAVPGAQRGQREFGVPASVTIAQGALESGWGASHIGTANNYFGIKAFGGTPGSIAIGSVVVPTKEFVGGRMVTVNGRFRAYRSAADSFRDHGLFLRSNSRYAPAFRVADDANAFARALQAAGYATDPQYANKLIATMRANNLYRFDVGGAPIKPVDPVKPPPPAANVRPAVAAVQRDLNTHLRKLGSPELLAVDGVWDTYTDRAFRRVCRMLGIPPKRGARAFRIIAGANVQLAPEEIARAQTEGAAFAAELSAQFHAHKPPDPPPADATVVGGTPLDARRRRAAYIAALQRDLNTQLARLGAPRPLDVDGEWGPDTDLAFRRVCKILGLAPERKIRTFRAIAGATAHRTAEELQEGDSDGAAYAVKLRAHFHTEQRQPLNPTDDDDDDDHADGPKPPAPRTFRIQSPLMEGEDIRAFQQVINARFEVWKVTRTIEVDGEYGSITRHAARQVAHGMGLAKRDYPGGITPEMRRRIRTPSRRSPEEKDRAQARRTWLRALRKQFEGGGADQAIAYARKHIGLREQSGNRGPLIDKWNAAAGSPLGSFWCGNFCNACLMAAGFPSESFLAVCGQIESHARTGQGGWSWHGSPRPGDLALFTISGAANHVGIVEAVTSTQVVTIEGNTHQDVDPGRGNDGYGVFRRHHPLGMPRGYARPPYAR